MLRCIVSIWLDMALVLTRSYIDLLADGWIKLGKGGKLDEYNFKFPSVTGMCLDHEDEEGSASVEDGEMTIDLDG